MAKKIQRPPTTVRLDRAEVAMFERLAQELTGVSGEKCSRSEAIRRAALIGVRVMLAKPGSALAALADMPEVEQAPPPASAYNFASELLEKASVEVRASAEPGVVIAEGDELPPLGRYIEFDEQGQQQEGGAARRR